MIRTARRIGKRWAAECYYPGVRIIVTGGAGFIGSQLVLELARRSPDAHICIVDEFSSADFRNISGFAGDVITTPCEKLDWHKTFAGAQIDCIYHLASITDTTITNQQLMIERNVGSFRRILDFAAQCSCKVVFSSSAATYGLCDGLMSEEMPTNPANVYGFSKVIMENLAREANANGLSISAVRYFNVYGPGEQHKGKMASMIYQLYRQMQEGKRPRIFRSGEHQRDFVYVKDAVEGTLLAAKPEVSGIFNIGSGSAVSFNDLVSILNEVMGTRLEPEYVDNPFASAYQNYTRADLRRAADQLGYIPQWDLAAGVADYVCWLEGGRKLQVAPA